MRSSLDWGKQLSYSRKIVLKVINNWVTHGISVCNIRYTCYLAKGRFKKRGYLKTLSYVNNHVHNKI